MIAMHVKNQDLSRRVVITNDLEALTEIYKNDVNLSVWQRELCPSVISQSQTLVTSGNFKGYRGRLSIDQLEQLQKIIPQLTDLPNLRSDIQLLADIFCCLFDLKNVGLRLEALSKAMCPKFHVDQVPCRLIHSYCGMGTQWIYHHDVHVDKSMSSNPYSKNVIHTLSIGDVALLKGERWEGNEGAGLVHRSPAADASQKRLLLTLDFA